MADDLIEHRLNALEKGHGDIQRDLRELTTQIKLLTQAMTGVPARLVSVEINQANTKLILRAVTGMSMLVAGTGVTMVMVHLFGR